MPPPVESLEQDLLRSVRSEPSQIPDGRVGFIRKLRFLGLGLFYTWLFLAFLSLFLLLKIPGDFLSGVVTEFVQSNTPYRINAAKDVSFILLPTPGVRVTGLEIAERLGEPLSVNELVFRPNLFRMFPWGGAVNPAGSFGAQIFGGELDGSFRAGTGLSLSLEAEGLALDQLPQKLLSLKGTISSAKLDVTHDGRWNTADGSLTFLGKDVVFDPASLQLPVPLPILSLGPVQAVARTDKGRLRIERLAMGEPGRDLEAHGQGFITLKQPLVYSEMAIEVKFKIGEKILKAVPALEGMLPMVAGKRSDGYWGMRLNGTFLAPGMPTPWMN
ncbi:MAG: type II secretion system protein GspN [Bdellovibrionales bacterium]|nr:type II secretion system protein GspN [Bdellovibrionales bacterium]